MRTLNLISLKLGLSDLFDKRLSDLLESQAGKYYHPRLTEIRDGIDALPAIFTGGLPHAEELQLADAEHDGYGAAVFFVTEVYLRLPNAAPAIVAAAKRIRAELIVELDELKKPYAVEADKAIERKAKLPELHDALHLFPMVGGGTLFEVAKKFLDAGEKIHHLLSKRADVPKGSRKEATALRSKAVGLLYRLREDIQTEVAKNPDLPRDLEHRVFGYLDVLHSMQPRPSVPEAAAPEASAAAPAASGTPT
jgi:hypothetical protein